jgi:RNA polymerase sigma-70 factor (ECF subfamily)
MVWAGCFVDGVMSDEPLNALAGTVRHSLHGFLDVYEPLRGDLYRYCRYLTSNAWDAEDLTQDTLARAFVTLGRMGTAPPNPRAWLFRVASNLWIDQTRRARLAPVADAGDAAWREPRDAREAGGTLIARLSPQERAAVVLKDVFDLEAAEIAEALSTSVGAVTAALHRGRGKLTEPAPDDARAARAPAPGVLDAFCAAFNARDLPALTALLLDNAAVEVVGTTTEYGLGKDGNILRGMMFGSERLANAATRGGIEARYVQDALPDSPRAEVRTYRGEPVILLWYRHRDGEAVRAVNRLETSDGRVALLRNYFFTSELIAEICTELDVPFRINGHRYWLTGVC